MMGTQGQRRKTFFYKQAGVILWILCWPLVSMLFDSNPHYPAFFLPIGVFSRSSLAPEGYYWSSAYLETSVFPASVFWLVLIGVLVFFPSKK